MLETVACIPRERNNWGGALPLRYDFSSKLFDRLYWHLCEVGDDVRPEHFRAFYFDGGAGFQIAPGVWHQTPYFGPPERGAASSEMTFSNKQSSVYACVLADIVNEFGVYLQVPLTLGAA